MVGNSFQHKWESQVVNTDGSLMDNFVVACLQKKGCYAYIMIYALVHLKMHNRFANYENSPWYKGVTLWEILAIAISESKFSSSLEES